MRRVKKKVAGEALQAPGTNRGKMNSFYAWEGDTLLINILGVPNARRDAIGKVKGNQLKVSIAGAPQEGRATDPLIAFLAEEFKAPKKDISVVSGRFSVNKQLRIQNPKNLPAGIIREG